MCYEAYPPDQLTTIYSLPKAHWQNENNRNNRQSNVSSQVPAIAETLTERRGENCKHNKQLSIIMSFIK